MSIGFGSRGELWGAGLAAALLAAALVARAQPAELELVWQAPRACPASVDVRAWIDELLGDTTVASPVVARGVVRPESDGYTLELELAYGDSRRRRVLQHDSCLELGRAGALVIALALAPEAATGSAVARFPDLQDLAEATASDGAATPQPPPASPPRPTAPAQVSGKATVRRSDRPPPPNEPKAGNPGRRRGFVQLTALGNAGALPGRLSPGLGLGLGAYLGASRYLLLAVELDAYAPRSTRLDETRGGDFQLLAATAWACLRLLANDGNFAYLLGCGLGEVNRMSGSGFGGDEWNGEGVGYWFAPGGAVELGLSEAEVDIGIRLGASFAIHPPSYVIENVGPVHQPGRLVGLLALVGRWSIL